MQPNQQHTELLMKIQQVTQNTLVPVTRDLRGNLLRDYLRTVQFTPLMAQVLVGIMLGDGTLQRNGGTNCFLKYDQCFKNTQLVYLVYAIFQDFVGTPPKLRYHTIDGERKEHSMWFRTFRLPQLTHYQNLFYALNALGAVERRVPANIEKLLTPIALAFWFMDDRSKNLCQYSLHTQCFTLPEVKRLQQALGKNFGLEVSVHTDNKKTGKSYYYLSIRSGSVKKFTQLVEPYIIESMRYKLHGI